MMQDSNKSFNKSDEKIHDAVCGKRREAERYAGLSAATILNF
jgi:hypothetical protein